LYEILFVFLDYNTFRQARNKAKRFRDLEIEFAKTSEKIKQALVEKNIKVASLVEQLRTISAVRMKNVPIFDEDIFKTVTTVESLWQKLSGYWTLLDYDVLICIVDIIDCKEVNDILNEFLGKIDVSQLEDFKLVLCCTEYRIQGTMPTLRIKLAVNEETVDFSVKEKVKEIVCKHFQLENYSLSFITIKEGCIELLYRISNPVMVYMLQFRFTAYTMAEFASKNIILLYINDTELRVPSSIANMVCEHAVTCRTVTTF